MTSDDRKIGRAALVGLVVAASVVGADASSILEVTQIDRPSHDSVVVALSPDDRHVYAPFDDGLAVLERDPATEVHTGIQVVNDGEGGITALAGPENAIVTPDGKSVLVSAGDTNALVVLERDPASGLLTFVEEHVDGVAGVDGLAGPHEIAVSPDSAFVYVAGLEDDSIAVFARDLVTGALTFLEAEGAGGDPAVAGVRTLAMTPDGLHLYVGGEGGQAGFVRDPGTGALTTLIFSIAGSYRSRAVRVSADGANVYYLNHGKPHYLQSKLETYTRDAGTGALTNAGTHTFGKNNDRRENPVSFEVRPDKAFVYVQIGAAVWLAHGCCVTFPRQFVRFDLDPVTGGAPSNRATVCNDDDCPPAGVDSFVFTSDGGTLIHAGADAVVTARVFEVDVGTGDLDWTSVGSATSFGTWTSAAATSPDGEHLYTAGRRWNSLAVFDRDPSDGMLTFVEAELDGFFGVDGIAAGSGVVVSPDGAHVYVSGAEDDAIGIFSRDAGTGEVSYLGMVADGIGGVDGLAGASAIAISPDGLHLYATGQEDDAVAAFLRDAGTGALSHLTTYVDGVAGVAGIAAPRGVIVSSDGQHVYVAGRGADAIAAFARAAGTGLLTPIEVQLDQVGEGPSDLALGPGGEHLYVSTFSEGVPAVAEFARDAVTGELAPQALHVDELEGVRGLAGAGRLVVAADGEAVYARSASFRRIPSTGALAFIESMLVPTGLDLGGFLVGGPDSKQVYGSSSSALLVHQTAFSGCAEAPLVGCGTAEKSNLTVRDHADDEKQKLKWSFVNGDPTTLAEFDPAGTKHYGFCVYDESGAMPALVLETLLPAHGDCRNNYASLEKPCWTATSKVKYKDRYLTPDGVGLAQLVPSVLPKVRIKIVGKGARLPIGGLPWGTPLRAQIQDSAGGCWEQLYPAAKKNDGTIFKAKAP